MAIEATLASPDRVLRPAELCALLGVGKVSLWRWVGAGLFPPPMRLGPAATGWRWSTVERWLDDRESDAEQRAATGAGGA
ncbi:MAG: helix-turn-helix transcriptional regulator [Thermoanaerobaculia bacterium]